MKVILFNGPPRCGKDTACSFLSRQNMINDVECLKFATPLHAAAQACVPPDLLKYYSEDNKDEIMPWMGVSYRNLCIGLSESYFKPTYGQDIFGKITAADIQQVLNNRQNRGFDDNVTFVFSDSGFACETVPVIEYVGEENVTLVQITRDGCSFANDSRNYIDLSNYGISPIKVVNDELSKFRSRILSIYYSTIGQ